MKRSIRDLVRAERWAERAEKHQSTVSSCFQEIDEENFSFTEPDDLRNDRGDGYVVEYPVYVYDHCRRQKRIAN